MAHDEDPWALQRVRHDLADPLRVARGSLDILEKRHVTSLPPEAARLVRLARESIEAADDIVEHMRPANARDAPRAALSLVSGATVARELSDVMSAAFPDAQIEIEVPDLWTDEHALRRVLQNLVANAAKHGGPHARVRVFPTREIGAHRISIVDEGPGISPREQPTLFRHNQRRDGHGMGLPNALDLVQELGGQLWIESAPGRGTAVHFTIPDK